MTTSKPIIPNAIKQSFNFYCIKPVIFDGASVTTKGNTYDVYREGDYFKILDDNGEVRSFMELRPESDFKEWFVASNTYSFNIKDTEVKPIYELRSKFTSECKELSDRKVFNISKIYDQISSNDEVNIIKFEIAKELAEARRFKEDALKLLGIDSFIYDVVGYEQLLTELEHMQSTIRYGNSVNNNNNHS